MKVKSIIDNDNNSKKNYNNLKKDTNTIVNVYSNIYKFKNFYKKLTTDEMNDLNYYKGNGYIDLNNFLYNQSKFKKIHLSRFFFIKKKNNEKPPILEPFIDYEKKIINNEPEFIEKYMNLYFIDMINRIDGLFNKKEIFKLDGNKVLYRGIHGKQIKIVQQKQVGDEILFKNYLSTSTNKSIAISFAGREGHDKPMCCLFMFHNIKNIPYIYLPYFNKILKKNLDITVKDIKDSFADEFEYLLPRNIKFKIIKITNGLPTKNDYGITFKKTFKKMEKILLPQTHKHILNNKKLNNNNYRDVIDKFFKKITIYHLEFIEQLPVEPMKPYIYKNDIVLDFNMEPENPKKSKTSKKSFKTSKKSFKTSKKKL
jgi:hypothetical protein